MCASGFNLRGCIHSSAGWREERTEEEEVCRFHQPAEEEEEEGQRRLWG
jgi:hypothetical protein